ncbi:MAG: hypothetical protein AAGC96_20725 [Pseudomonadota bacterium]
MTEVLKKTLKLSDEDIVTRPRLTRRSVLTAAGVGLGSVALTACGDDAEDSDGSEDTDSDDGSDSDEETDTDDSSSESDSD